ncbi:hypothetical protein K461DRAFT_230958 [Myriangium duriaei CBS 260.36]|uniref:Autophagy-related protein 13 n=1 Tax=Myriangium duriaei CBS 260.36 TaxID=1168546 RepID=A0A9P4MCZ7_9PEZI|nr:hypothetical protein K461DRAFT_230958 [Myriangium duriaei CBS 260.36]
MHQHPRPAPRSASAASNLQTNPTRTNNQREEQATRAQSSLSLSSESGSGKSHLSDNGKPEDSASAQNPERQRLNLIVQRFFSKAALIIVSARVQLPPAHTRDGEVRLEKWFNTWIKDTNALNPEIDEWRKVDASTKPPPTLRIEFYLDLNQHPQSQSLVSVDEDHKKWDVAKSLETQAKLQGAATSPSEVIYERWTVNLEDPSTLPASQLTDPPPNIYKKGVVLLRSLYSYAMFLPAWKFSRKLSRQAGNGYLPKPKFRIVKGEVESSQDTLDWPLTNEPGPVTEEYNFNRLPCAFGALKVSVRYRTNCNFELDAAERLLSAQIATGSGNADSSTRAADSTSEELAGDSRYKPWARMPSGERDDGPYRLTAEARALSGSKSSLRSENVSSSVPRRTSVSFQPFKAGSLSSSPAGGVLLAGSPGASYGRPVGAAPPAHSRSRSSLNTLPQQALRNPGLANETAIASSASSSPKPAPIQRYSSSFSNRRARFPSTATASKPDDDASSSRGSVSSGHRGSTALAEQDSSLQDDAESIGDFLKMLDKSSRQVSLTKTDPASLAANSKRTSAQYSKFAKMKDSTAQLSDSMSSSIMLQRSSTPSSRQLSNVPGLIGGHAASVSTSSSPGGKPISPHTPHMPAIPSRLSNNSVVSYTRPESGSLPRSVRTEPSRSAYSRESTVTPGRAEASARAIDIPSSPRVFPVSRRSSSVNNNQRSGARMIARGAIDDEGMPFGLRSASLPNNDDRSMVRTHSGGVPIRGEGSGSGGIDRGDEEEEDEPLLFDLGELGRESMRRS